MMRHSVTLSTDPWELHTMWRVMAVVGQKLQDGGQPFLASLFRHEVLELLRSQESVAEEDLWYDAVLIATKYVEVE